MIHKETKLRIDRLNNNLYKCYISYFIWKYLYFTHTKVEWEIFEESHMETINKYKYFFRQTESANLQIFILGIAKLFDNNKNNQPISINKTRNYIHGNKKRYTVKEFKSNNKDRLFISELCENYEGITNDNILEIDEIVKKNTDIIKRFRTLRDKRIAHDDKEEIEKTIPPFEKIEGLFSDIVKIINIMSYWLEHNITSYSHIEGLVEEDMNRLFAKLKD